MSYNQSISAIGGYPSLGYGDMQYLAAAMNTPNVNDPSFRGTSATAQLTQTNQPATPTVAFQGVQDQPEEKSNKRAKIVLGAIVAIGAGACILGYAKGNADLKGFQRIGDGLKNVWNGLRSKAGSAASSTAESAREAATKGKNTIQEIDGNTVVTLAGKKNRIDATKLVDGVQTATTESTKAATDALGELGLELPQAGKIIDRCTSPTVNGETIQTLKAGNVLDGFNTLIEREGVSYRVIGTNTAKGQKIIIQDASGKVLTAGDDIIRTTYNGLVDEAKKIFSGKTPLDQVDKVLIRSTDKSTGAVSHIMARKGDETVLRVITDRFTPESDAVQALARKHPKLNEIFESFATKGGEGLKTLIEEVPVNGGIKTGGVTFTVDSQGRAIGIAFQDGGKDVFLDANLNREAFDAAMNRFREDEKLIGNIKKENRLNKIFELIF